MLLHLRKLCFNCNFIAKSVNKVMLKKQCTSNFLINILYVYLSSILVVLYVYFSLPFLTHKLFNGYLIGDKIKLDNPKSS